ncbi:hypothetical protein CHUAL_007870 [Chamberlinius hualienensis]
MNAIIALCHFCETHGPSVMFCTQSFHDSDDPQSVFEDKSKQHQQIKKNYYGKPEIYQRSQSVNPSTSSNGCVDSEKGKDCASDDNPTSVESCEACKLIPPGLSGYISNDHEAKVSYISSHNPFHPEIFSIVRQACVRSLSCEVCPGREGPIFFGDQQRGHVYSHTFFVKDSHSRGFQRWYSIIVVMMDKIFLLNSWPFLTKHIRTIIDELQEKANKVYETEQAECPQRVVRLNNWTGVAPGNFRRPRGSSKTMRSLKELTNDKDVFANLHLWFTWILRAGGNRMMEKLLEGPPTEDTVIDLEKQEETEDGFTIIATKTVPNDGLASSSKAAFRNLKKPEQSKTDMKIKNIQHLRKIVGQNVFKALAYNVIVGNQLIVVSDDEDLAKSVIHHLKILLPKGCIRDASYSDSYVESWKCNMIGVPPTASLPVHLELSSLHIILEIINCLGAGCKCSNPGVYKYKISSKSLIPDKGPTVYERMINIVENDQFDERVTEEFFISLKEEWMNKVKVFYKFLRTGDRSLEDTHKLLNVLGAHQRDKEVKT